MRFTIEDYNKLVREKAKRYLASVLSLSRAGPDRSSLAYTLWTSVALPAILYGAEVIPMTKGTIDDIESCQSLIGKFILQVPRSTSNVAAQIDAGLKPVWSLIAQKVLKYANNTAQKPLSNWARLAFRQNLDMGYNSSYTRYFLDWKQKLDTTILSSKQIEKAANRAAIKSVVGGQKTQKSLFAMSLPSTNQTQRWFKMKSWINDSCLSKVELLFIQHIFHLHAKYELKYCTIFCEQMVIIIICIRKLKSN